MHCSLKLLRGLLAMLCLGTAFAAEPTAPDGETVRRLFPGLGELRWQFAREVPMQFVDAGEEFGPNVRCVGGRVDCTMRILGRDLAMPDEWRVEELRQIVQPALRISLSRNFKTRQFGAVRPVVYVLMEARWEGGWRYMVNGYVNRGPAFIGFNILANDLRSIQDVLNVVYHAKVLNAEEYWAARFPDFNAACSLMDPQSKERNESALAASPFGQIDVTAFHKRQRSEATPEQLERLRSSSRAKFERFFESLPLERQRVMCASIPQMLDQAVAEL